MKCLSNAKMQRNSSPTREESLSQKTDSVISVTFQEIDIIFFSFESYLIQVKTNFTFWQQGLYADQCR